MPILARNGGRDEGNAALELVVLAPVLLFILGLVVAAGRTSIAQGAVDAAARDAARQASISLTPGRVAGGRVHRPLGDRRASGRHHQAEDEQEHRRQDDQLERGIALVARAAAGQDRHGASRFS